MPKLLLTNTVRATERWAATEANASYSTDKTTKATVGKAAVDTIFTVQPGVTVTASGDFPAIANAKKGWEAETVGPGSFAAGDWTFACKLESDTKYGFSVRLAARVSRSTAADGSNATQIAISESPNSIAVPAVAGNTITDSWTWAASAFELAVDEYLFVEYRLKITVAGSNAAAQCSFLCDDDPATGDESVTTTVWGVTHQLAGISTTQTMSTGTSIINLVLSGISASLTTGEGTLLFLLPLAGVGTTETAGTGTLTVVVYVFLAGVSTTETTGSGILLAQRMFSGISATETSGLGAIALMLKVAGESTTVTDGIGNITATFVVSGISVTETAGEGRLLLKVRLAGISATETTGEGLLNLLLGLAGSSATVTDGAGNLVAVITVSGISVTETAGTGTLTIIVELGVSLSGTSTTEAAGTGLLTLERLLSGASLTETTGVGPLNLLLAVAGTSATATTGTGWINLVTSLAGASATVADGAGTIRLELRLAGISATETDGIGLLVILLAPGIPTVIFVIGREPTRRVDPETALFVVPAEIVLRISRENLAFMVPVEPTNREEIVMAGFYLFKQPNEEITFGIDMTGFREIQAGETIASATVACTLDGVPVEDMIVSKAHTTTVVSVRVKGGISGKRYLVAILATTNAGHTREADVLLTVEERR